MYTYLMIILPMVSIMVLIFNQSHFLMSLLSLEGITLSILLYTTMIMYMMNNSLPSMSILILSMGACEASIGLSLMVLMTRSMGSDMMTLMNLNKC